MHYNLQDVPLQASLLPKQYYATTRQAKNLYSTAPVFPSVTTASIYRLEGNGNEYRQPKAYDSGFPTSVADKLPPISTKSHGKYGLYNNAPTDYDVPPPPPTYSSAYDLPSPPPASFPLGRYGTAPHDILPNLLPPHMYIIENRQPPPTKVEYKSNSFYGQSKLEPVVRFHYIHHTGPQKSNTKKGKYNYEDYAWL